MSYGRKSNELWEKGLMRVFILGLDALEYNLVAKNSGLKNLKQKEYGKLTLPRQVMYRIGKGNLTPYTPFVWSAIVTGRLPKETGLMVGLWNNRVINLLKRLTIKVVLDKVEGKPRARARKVSTNVLTSMGFKMIPWSRKNYHAETVFDLTSESIQVNVPTVDPKWQLFFAKGLTIAQLKDKMRLQFFKISEKMKMEMKKDWELFMGYTRLLDIFGHTAWNTKELMRMYQKADSLVGELKKLIDGDHLFLVVSDHGMKRLEGTKHGGIHTHHAYYSSNIPLNLEAPTITDIFCVVKDFLARKY